MSAPPEWARGSSNPPLTGNFAPVVGECELRDLEIVGALPPGVSGVYLRNGPNPAREPLLGADRYHWFDGDGMIHWIRLEVGCEDAEEEEEDEGEELEEERPPADDSEVVERPPADDSEVVERPAADDSEVVERPAASASQSERASSSTTSSSTTSGPRRQRASYGRRYVETRGFARERAANRPLYTGLRDINPVWRVLLPRLAEKARLDWRSPDAPFWVIQSKNTANNGVKYHAGRLLATTSPVARTSSNSGPSFEPSGRATSTGR